jgi:hypothetical protein
MRIDDINSWCPARKKQKAIVSAENPIKIYPVGNKWCVSAGSGFQSFGKSPTEAWNNWRGMFEIK